MSKENVIIKEITFQELVHEYDLYQKNKKQLNGASSVCEKRDEWTELEPQDVFKTYLEGNKYTERLSINADLGGNGSKPQFKWNEYGSSLNMPKLLSNDPRPFRKRKRRAAKRIFQRIIVHCGCLAEVNGEHIVNRGIAILEALNSLHDMNVEFEKVQCFNGVLNYQKKHMLHFVTIPSRPFDMDSFSFCVALPDFNRRLLFMQREKDSNFSSYGGTQSFKDLNKSLQIDVSDAIVFDYPGSYRKWADEYGTIDAARKSIKRIIEKQLGKSFEPKEEQGAFTNSYN
jgi:hypothetical protein